jgi:predicted phosphodiesterase
MGAAKATLFISDLHLDGRHPQISAQFIEFLKQEASAAEALYILGDLFELWIGDDDPDPEKRRIVQALHELTDRSVPCYVMNGNRDFLYGPRFAQDSGCQLLEDPIVVHLYGERVLVTHGDALCTDDHSYQNLRAGKQSACGKSVDVDNGRECRDGRDGNAGSASEDAVAWTYASARDPPVHAGWGAGDANRVRRLVRSGQRVAVGKRRV